MSTRCNIKVIVDGETICWLYHHHDGYPEGVGANLAEFLHKCNDKREYVPMFFNYVINDMIKGKVTWVDGTPDDEYEWTGGQHGDIEYLYTIEYAGRTVTLNVEGIYRTEDNAELYRYEGKTAPWEVEQ